MDCSIALEQLPRGVGLREQVSAPGYESRLLLRIKRAGFCLDMRAGCCSQRSRPLLQDKESRSLLPEH